MIATRAGEYAAEWTVASMPSLQRALIKAAPGRLRGPLLLRLGSRLVRSTYRGTRVVARLRGGMATVDVRDSLFCTVREPVTRPLCGFYAAAFTRVLSLFNIDARADVIACRGRGETSCVVQIAQLSGHAFQREAA